MFGRSGLDLFSRLLEESINNFVLCSKDRDESCEVGLKVYRLSKITRKIMGVNTNIYKK